MVRETCLQPGYQHLAEESFVDNILTTPHPPALCPAPWALAGSVNKPLCSWWDSRGTVVLSACLFCLAVLSWVEHGPNSQNLPCADLSWVSDLLHGL